MSVPTNFNYLGPDDAETVLVKLWGNPPSNVKPLGLLIPADMTPISSNCWVVTIHYSEDGYVKDGDAGKINYDDLLKQMQKGIAENNKAREEHGYPDLSLIHIFEGDTVIHSLTAVQYDENELKRQMKAQMDEAIKSDRMKPSEAMRLLDDYERGLKAYTYLSF